MQDPLDKINDLNKELYDFSQFVDSSVLISKADAKGNITYVNKKFEEVSGWPLEEVVGKNHNIVNSGIHNKIFWSNMYKTVIVDKGIWNSVVTNKTKNGDFYYVDTYIKGEFDINGKLMGFISIRHDVTLVKKNELEIKNIINAINQSNAVIEFDLFGNIILANDNFCHTMGYSQEELIGKHHSIFVDSEYSKSEDYKEFWVKLSRGEFISSRFVRIKHGGEIIWLQATYNPIIDDNGKVVKIMKIAIDVTDKILQSEEIEKKNTYLEHAAKILRHDMHSGINTYIPRGLSSLERRLTQEDINKLKIEAPLKMIKEGLKHTQKVYKGVYEFTNLVKKDSTLNKGEYNIKDILQDYLSATAYKSQVLLDNNLPTIEVNEALFCTAIDNLIRNGLKYNDSSSRLIKIYLEDGYICVEDNGRGITQKEFDELSKPYVRKEGQKETGTGLGLNICKSILKEHGFSITVEKMSQGTKIKIK